MTMLDRSATSGGEEPVMFRMEVDTVLTVD
jgi:hypothetical protein